MIEQKIGNTLATYETNKNNVSKQSGVESSIHGSNKDIPKACTYKKFINYKPDSFYDNEGVVGMTLWIENMESIFHNSSCAENYRVKFATCTFMDATLT